MGAWHSVLFMTKRARMLPKELAPSLSLSLSLFVSRFFALVVFLSHLCPSESRKPRLLHFVSTKHKAQRERERERICSPCRIRQWTRFRRFPTSVLQRWTFETRKYRCRGRSNLISPNGRWEEGVVRLLMIFERVRTNTNFVGWRFKHSIIYNIRFIGSQAEDEAISRGTVISHASRFNFASELYVPPKYSFPALKHERTLWRAIITETSASNFESSSSIFQHYHPQISFTPSFVNFVSSTPLLRFIHHVSR